MALRIVIVGPGRVGVAFAKRLAASGHPAVGIIGRDPARTSAAVAAVGHGRVLSFADVGGAHVVVFAVGDGDLPAAVQAAAGAARSCSLWLHTSACHGLAVFDGVAGIRRGALHPAAPFADVGSAAPAPGAPAVILGDPRAMRLLRRLCAWLGLRPIVARDGDRVLYHAACALAANGLTALFAAAEGVLARAGVVADGDARPIVLALMQAAVAACGEHGAAAALSGPVRRGDATTVARHLQQLRAAAPEAVPLYRSTAVQALALARERGLPPEQAAAVAAALGAAD